MCVALGICLVLYIWLSVIRHLLVHKVIKINNEQEREERIIINFHYSWNCYKMVAKKNAHTLQKEQMYNFFSSLTCLNTSGTLGKY